MRRGVATAFAHARPTIRNWRIEMRFFQERASKLQDFVYARRGHGSIRGCAAEPHEPYGQCRLRGDRNMVWHSG